MKLGSKVVAALLALGAAALLAVPPEAIAQQIQDFPVLPGKAWLRAPSGDDLARHWPGAEGRAVLHCTITATGALTDCQVAEESPLGHRIGAAALATTNLFVAKPTLDGGRETAGMTIALPFSFSRQ